MNDNDNRSCDCSRWEVTLPPRPMDFSAVCSCAESCDCRSRSRVRLTVATLAVCVACGALLGGLGARHEDSKNLATLRETHLRDLGTGGDR